MANSPATLTCANLPADAIVRQAVLSERLGAVSALQITVTVPKVDFEEAGLINQRAKLSLTLSGEQEQVFGGRVTHIDYAGFIDNAHLYQLTVRSTLSKLDGGRRYRIFQSKSASDIVKQVLGDAGISDLDMSLREPCPDREYCAQFGESDLAFVQRLCEQEGLFYAIVNDDSSETVVFADTLDGASARSKSVDLVFAPRVEGEPSLKNEINAWTSTHAAMPIAIDAKGYDFRSPRKPLAAHQDAEGNAQSGLAAETHLPGRYATQNSGDRYVKAHAEAISTAAVTFRARTSAVALRPGQRFNLTKHPRSSMNGEYVVVASDLVIQAPGGRGVGSGDWQVSHEVEVAPAQSSYRLLASTPQPRVGGPQLAIVTGRSGDEVTTDEHGRVKVKFRWDPADGADEKSSCWLRVMQSWAGSARGVSVVPRIGDEVVVGFADGNPDFPFVLGSLYHGEAKAAANLPSVPTDFVIRTRSSKGGGQDTYNEIRLSDAQGSELFGIQAQKDFKGLIKNDSKLEIQNNRSDSIGHEYKIDAGDLLEITVGQSKLKMDSAGNITLSGMSIKIEADVDAMVKGTQTKVQGVMLDLNADGIASLQAALTKIG